MSNDAQSTETGERTETGAGAATGAATGTGTGTGQSKATGAATGTGTGTGESNPTGEIIADPTTAPTPGLQGLPYEAQEIQTEHLLLRPLKKSDVVDVDAYQKRKDVFRYLLWEVRDHEEPAKRFEKHLALTRLAADGDGLIYAVELPDPSGEHGRVIGDISIYLKSEKQAQLEVGWVFHPAVHGRGFATEAAQAILRLCFETLGAHRVYAELDARNDASARLCEILGMRHEGVLRENELFRDEWIDTSIFALLASEFAG